MDDKSKQLLRETLDRHRVDIVEQATDWVRGVSVDLGTKRPREETWQLVQKTSICWERALLHDDLAPYFDFIDYMTSFRATSEFHVSTPLRGLFAVRYALARVLRQEAPDGWAAFDILEAMDQVYTIIACRMADLYMVKLNETIKRRRDDLENELQSVTEAKVRELSEKIDIIEAQRTALAIVSSPVIRVWKGILVVPLVGEITKDRLDDLMQKALMVVQDSRADVMILDVTGLTVMDGQVAMGLLRLTQAIKLLGAESMLVGVSPRIARTMLDLSLDIRSIRAYATLHEGLRMALRQQGLVVVARATAPT